MEISLLLIRIIMIIPPFPISFKFNTNFIFIKCVIIYFLCFLPHNMLLPISTSQTTQHDFLLLINVGCTNLLEFSPFVMEKTASARKEENMTNEIHLLIQPLVGGKIVIVHKGS